MARFEIINNSREAKIYNVKVDVAQFDANDTGLVSNGLVGKIGARVEDNVYELKALEAETDQVFFLASPEVDADESDYKKNTLLHFQNDVADVLDAVEIPVNRKFAVSENGIEGTIIDKAGYVYAKVGEIKLQYSATMPVADAVSVAIIEEVVPATQGLFVGVGGANLAMQYNIVRCRVIK